MNIITPEQTALMQVIRNRQPHTDNVTTLLRLKAEGLTHAQIGEKMGYSTSWVNQTFQRFNRQYHD